MTAARSQMSALPVALPAEGLDPATSIDIPWTQEQRLTKLRRALALGMTLNMDGHSIRWFQPGAEIEMDGLTPIAANDPLTPSGNVYFTAENGWLAEAYAVEPGAVGGCGVGYLGCHLSLEEAISVLNRSWSNLDITVLCADMGLWSLRNERRVRRS